jgi:tetratricopeptide (TPR) repeat protein
MRGCRTTINPQTLSPDAALARGWCLMELNRPVEAAAAFEVGLLGASAKTREDAAYGQSLAFLRSGLASKAAVAAVKAPQNRQRALELQTAILADKAVAAFDAGRPRETLLALDQLKQITPERTDLMALRGYAYLKLKRYGDARRVFEALAAIGNTDGQRGVAIIHEMFHGND